MDLNCAARPVASTMELALVARERAVDVMGG